MINNIEIKTLLKNSEYEAKLLNSNYVGTEHIFLALLKNNKEFKIIFNKRNIYYNQFKSYLIKNNFKIFIPIYTPLLKKILSKINDNSSVKNIVLLILENYEGIAITILNQLNTNIYSLYSELNNDFKINNYGVNLNEQFFENNLVCRENELNKIINILCRKNKNNPLLIGDAGVGKTALIEELSMRINNKNVPEELYDKKIFSINISSIVSGTKYRGEFEEKINKIISNFENNNDYILFIDEIHTLVGAGGAEGAIDASNILKPYLARNKIKCIGATTINEYKKYIENDKALSRRFELVQINEPNKQDTINIIQNNKYLYEKYHKVKINDKQIELIVNLSSKYIKNKKEPDRSLDMLDNICTYVKLNNNINKKNKLNLLKSKYLYCKDYINAIKINKKIYTLNDSIVVKNQDIYMCYKLDEINCIGYKI